MLSHIGATLSVP